VEADSASSTTHKLRMGDDSLACVADKTREEYRSEALLRDLAAAKPFLNMVSDLVLALDVEGNIAFLNHALQRVLGATEAGAYEGNWIEQYGSDADASKGNSTIQSILSAQVAPAPFHQEIRTTRNETKTISW
jgi:PAS domain-containing protein